MESTLMTRFEGADGQITVETGQGKLMLPPGFVLARKGSISERITDPLLRLNYQGFSLSAPALTLIGDPDYVLVALRDMDRSVLIIPADRLTSGAFKCSTRQINSIESSKAMYGRWGWETQTYYRVDRVSLDDVGMCLVCFGEKLARPELFDADEQDEEGKVLHGTHGILSDLVKGLAVEFREGKENGSIPKGASFVHWVGSQQISHLSKNRAHQYRRS